MARTGTGGGGAEEGKAIRATRMRRVLFLRDIIKPSNRKEAVHLWYFFCWVCVKRVCEILHTPTRCETRPPGGAAAISPARFGRYSYNVHYVKFIMQCFQWLIILKRTM